MEYVYKLTDLLKEMDQDGLNDLTLSDKMIRGAKEELRDLLNYYTWDIAAVRDFTYSGREV